MRQDNRSPVNPGRSRVQGEANMLLRVLAARGFAVSEEMRERITSCVDTSQLEAWADRAVTAGSIQGVFG